MGVNHEEKKELDLNLLNRMKKLPGALSSYH